MPTSRFRSHLWMVLPLLLVATRCEFPRVLATEAAQGEVDRHLTVSGPVVLTVRSGSGGIEVKAGELGSVHVTATIHARAHSLIDANEKVERLISNPPVTQRGNQIDVGRIEDDDLRRNVRISYVITVPTTTEIEARVGSGEVRIDGVIGPVAARTGSGRVEVSNVERGVLARAGSGRIELNTIAGDVEAQAGSGRLKFTGLSGGLTAVTGSGPIEAHGRPTQGWRVRTGSGRVTLSFPDDAAFDVLARSGSGGVDIEHPLITTGRATRNAVSGAVRGGGSVVDVKTGSGRIRIE